MASIRIKPGEISIDETGKVTINNPALAEALREAKKKGTYESGGSQDDPGFLDWKCTNLKC